MTAVTLLPVTSPGGGVGNLWLQHCGVVIQLFVPLTQRALCLGLLVGNHIVDASSLVIFLPALVWNRF
jgi:hypothetical protein